MLRQIDTSNAALALAVKQFGSNIDPSRAADFVNFAIEKFARLGLLMAETPGA
jgi:hypothetical protein